MVLMTLAPEQWGALGRGGRAVLFRVRGDSIFSVFILEELPIKFDENVDKEARS